MMPLNTSLFLAGMICLVIIGALTVLFIAGVVVLVIVDKSDNKGHTLKDKKLPSDAFDAGIRDLLEEGREDEAVEVYQKFAGVDEYTARDMVSKVKQEMK